MVSSLRQLFHWKRQARYRLLPWIRQVPSPTVNPVVTDMVPAEGVTEESLLALAASLEKRSEHPLAKAILKYAGEQQMTVEDVSEFEAFRAMD